jgi:hypothetical protein
LLCPRAANSGKSGPALRKMVAKSRSPYGEDPLRGGPRPGSHPAISVLAPLAGGSLLGAYQLALGIEQVIEDLIHARSSLRELGARSIEELHKRLVVVPAGRLLP